MQCPINTTNESSMSGTTINATTNYDTQIFTGLKSEFGMHKFADPHRRATYEDYETRYKNMLTLKHAYDKQEFLRKMRSDTRREYLTRKKQLKRLQMDAAVDFRNAEYKLQEHYSTTAAERRLDINAPLITQIQLPSGHLLDLKTFDQEREFAKVRRIHEDLRVDQTESIKYWEEQEQYQQQRPYEPVGEEEETNTGNYWECEDANCSTCGHDDELDSYVGDEADQREQRERRAWEALTPAQQEQLWIENTRDSDGETWDEEARADEAEHRHEQFLLEELHAQLELNDDMTYQCDDYPDVQQLDVVQVTEPKERITAAAAGGVISAKTKAKSKTKAAAAARARIAKKQQNQFIPIQITVNTNRSDVDDAASALLYRGKVQINLPKKNYQITGAKSEAAAREAKKRDAAKWKRINTADKQSNARGTRIANIPVPRAWHNCGGGSDCE